MTEFVSLLSLFLSVSQRIVLPNSRFRNFVSTNITPFQFIVVVSDNKIGGKRQIIPITAMFCVLPSYSWYARCMCCIRVIKELPKSAKCENKNNLQ